MKKIGDVLEEDFWSKKEEDVLDELGSSKEGISNEEAHLRIKKYGQNVLKKKKYKGLKIFLRQFKSPFLLILLITVIVSAFWGEIINAIIISSMILLSSILSFYDEYKSEKIAESLSKRISNKCIVSRSGEKQEINSIDLVPGDIVYLNIGDIVPADLRLIYTKELEINESVLTGESNPTIKTHNAINKASTLQELTNYAFTGTVIAAGEAIGVIINIGQNTVFGKISKESITERPLTSFQKGLSKFGGLLVKLVVFLTLGIFLINALLGRDVLDSLLFSLAIAIGLTPELLPAVISVSLSKGAHAMAKKDVIVKRLVSIEDFGNMDILCTDKTGTLTEGNLSLIEHLDSKNNSNEKVLLYGQLCNSAIIHGKKVVGNPIDVAIINHVQQKFKKEIKNYEKIDELPFDYERKRMSVVVKEKNGKILIITKGSPEAVLGKCSKTDVNGRINNISQNLTKINEKIHSLAKEGFRVIVLAYKEVDKKEEYILEDESNLIFFGYLSFLDPPKKGIRAAFDKLESLNIKFKILTGDNEIVTKRVAEQVDIPLKKIVLAEEINNLSDTQLKKVVEEANAFCRLNPQQKLRIIKILKSNGHNVGYMGDGVNDVPALHEADVGISVNDAVHVAKEASDIILIKKNIHSLVDGVIEGRKVFNNTIKYILIGTSSNFGNMISAAGASVFLPFLPMLPIQILFVNFLYDTSQLTIPTDNVDEEELIKPKKMEINSIKKYMWTFGPISSIYDFMTYFVMIVIFKAGESLFQTGWFIESMMTQLLVVFLIRTKRSPFYKSKPGKWLFLSIISVGLIVLITPFTPLGTILGFKSPPLTYFLVLIAMVVTYLTIVEFVKKWFFKKYNL